MKERRDEGKEGLGDRKCGMQELRDSGRDGCRKRRIHD